MLEAILLKLVTSLTGFLFEGYLDTFKSIEIEGAPSWYERSGSKEMLVGYGYAEGGISSIEIAKNKCKMNIIHKINKGIEVSISDNFQYIKSQKEKEFINRFKIDNDLDLFVAKTMQYEKIEHFEAQTEGIFQKARQAQTFTGCMIAKEDILTYQKNRLETIKKELLGFKSNNALDEMEAELENMNKK